MARSSLRILLALGAFFVLAVSVAACGGIPGDAVATVDGTPISKASFDHWLIVAAKSQAQGLPGQQVLIPDPPKFTKCIAQLRKQTPPPAKGQPKVTDQSLKTQCSSQYASLRDQVMQFLISSQWVQREAADQGIKVTDAEVQKQFNASKKQAFQTPKAFQQFLQSSGMTQADLLFRVRVDALSTKLRNKVSKQAKPVTAAQISSYYNAHQSQFGTPEKRDLLVVLTKTQADAQKALSELKAGQSFAAVSKQLSIDSDSRSHGGLLPGVIKGQEDRALDAAAFSAPKGKLLGPVKTAFGYYVFQVKSIKQGNQQSLAQATSTIRSILTAQGQQKVLTDFVTSFQKKWKAKTDCRSGFVNPDCKNAPKTTSTATAPSGAVPQPSQSQTTTVGK